jgi:hypothetical protein
MLDFLPNPHSNHSLVSSVISFFIFSTLWVKCLKVFRAGGRSY